MLPSECTPPAVILEPCATPSVRMETTGDLVQAIIDYHEALQICASKVDALRLYHAQHGGSEDVITVPPDNPQSLLVPCLHLHRF